MKTCARPHFLLHERAAGGLRKATRLGCSVAQFVCLLAWLILHSSAGADAPSFRRLEIPRQFSGQTLSFVMLVQADEGVRVLGWPSGTTSWVGDWREADGWTQRPLAQSAMMQRVSANGRWAVSLSGSSTHLHDLEAGTVQALPVEVLPEGGSADSRTLLHLGSDALVTRSIQAIDGITSVVRHHRFTLPGFVQMPDLPQTLPDGAGVAQVYGNANGSRLAFAAKDQVLVWGADGLVQHLATHYNAYQGTHRSIHLSDNGQWGVLNSSKYGMFGSTPERFSAAVADRFPLDGPQAFQLQPLGHRPLEYGFIHGSGNVLVRRVLDDGTVLGQISDTTNWPYTGPIGVWPAGGERRLLVDLLREHYGLNLPDLETWNYLDSSADGQALLFAVGNQFQLLLLSEPLPNGTAEPNLELLGQTPDDGPAVIALPELAPGATSVQQQILLYSTGDADAVLLGWRLEGTDADHFAVANLPESLSLPVAHAQSLDLTYTPGGQEEHEAVLVLQTNHPRQPEWTVQLIGQGPRTRLSLHATADTTAAPAPLRVAAAAGRAVRATLHVKNSGNLPAEALSLDFEHSGNGSFRVVTEPLPVIPPGGREAIAFEWQPEAVGAELALVRVTCADPAGEPATLPLDLAAFEAQSWQAEVGDSVVTPEQPGELDFGPVTLNTPYPYPVLTFQVTNLGEETIQAPSLQLEGTVLGNGLSASLVLPGGASSLPPKGYGTVRVVFNPSTLDSLDAQLRLDAPASVTGPLLIQLKGQSVAGALPSFQEVPQTQVSVTGNPAPGLDEVHCRVLGAFPMSVTLVHADGRRRGLNRDLTGVNAYSTSLPTDFLGGPYHLEASNAQGTTSSPPFSRNVVSITPAMIHKYPSGVKIPTGVQGAPPAEETPAVLQIFGSTGGLDLQWFKGGLPLTTEQVGSPVTDRTLTIFPLRPGDTGIYSCRLSWTNGNGQSVSHVLGEHRLQIIGPPVIQPTLLQPVRVRDRVSFHFALEHFSGHQVTYRIRGLPPGLRANAYAGHVDGVVAATAAKSVPKGYRIRVSATNLLGTGPELEIPLRVYPFHPDWAGTWHARLKLEPEHGFTPHRLDGFLKLTLTPTGTYSWQCQMEGKTYRRTGLVEFPDDYGNGLTPEGSPVLGHLRLGDPQHPVPTGGTRNATVAIAVADGTLTGRLGDYRLTGVRVTSAPVSVTQGLAKPRFHFGLSYPCAAVTGEPSDEQVSGGYGVLQLQARGTAVLTGRLPDGAAFTAASGIGPASDSTWALPFQLCFKGAAGDVGGDLTFPAEASPATAVAQWRWLASERTFADGLLPEDGLLPLSGQGSLYLPPVAVFSWPEAFRDSLMPVKNAGMRLRVGAPLEDLTTPFTASPRGALKALTPPANAQLSVRWMRQTGLFSLRGQHKTGGGPEATTAGRLTGTALWLPHEGRATGVLQHLLNREKTPLHGPLEIRPED